MAVGSSNMLRVPGMIGAPPGMRGSVKPMAAINVLANELLFCPSPFHGYWMSRSFILAPAALAAFHKFMIVAWSPEANSS
jgi:hypothetical protein